MSVNSKKANGAMRVALVALFGSIGAAKVALLRKTGNRCWLCHGYLTFRIVTFDHIVPVVYGGTHAWENLMPAHKHCNDARRDRPPRLR